MENTLYQNVRQVILNAKAKINYAVNFAIVETYWLIGKYRLPFCIVRKIYYFQI